jgi:crotonobetainyl-CoA:carnitine CoA-transferase CaiB-like acyl-CoA transferase
VVDLSSLWAGPLCAHLLALLGAEVVHVESTQRPDPTREVAPGFHRLLRSGIDQIRIDFKAPDDLRRLHDLLLGSDIVIEASRPRALAQLGIDAHAIAAESGHCTWVSITAYGRQSHRIGFGDDVAAAAGLLGDGPVFAADAIADPMTGTHAARTALSGWIGDNSGVIDISMYDVVRAARTPLPAAEVVSRDGSWYVDDGSELTAVRLPVPRSAA